MTDNLNIVLNNLDIIINCKHQENCKCCKYNANTCKVMKIQNNKNIILSNLYPLTIEIITINDKKFKLEELKKLKNLKSL